MKKEKTGLKPVFFAFRNICFQKAVIPVALPPASSMFNNEGSRRIFCSNFAPRNERKCK